MTNTAEKAAGWVDYLASHPAVPFGQTLRTHFAAGRISRLCECGCNSFDFEIPDNVVLEPLCEVTGRFGKFFEVAFETDAEAEIACLFFADARGYRAGIDVTRGGANHAPVPEHVTLGKVAYVV